MVQQGGHKHFWGVMPPCKIGLAQFKVSGIISDCQCNFELFKVGYMFFLLGGYFSPMVPGPLLIA